MKSKKTILIMLMLLCLMLLVTALLKSSSSETEVASCPNLNVYETNNTECNKKAPNLINGSFEENVINDYIPNTVEGWDTDYSDISIIDSENDEYQCYDQNYCLDVNVPNYNTISTEVSLEDIDNRDNTLSFEYYPIDEYASLKVGIVEKDSNGEIINEKEEEVEITDYEQWQNYQMDIKVADETSTVQIWFSTDNYDVTSYYNVLIDNVQFGGSPVYDLEASLDKDGSRYTLSTDITLVSGVATSGSYRMELNQGVSLVDVAVNYLTISEDDINTGIADEIIKDEDEDFDNDKISWLDLKEVPNTINTNIEINMDLDSIDIDNNIMSFESTFNYNNYYAKTYINNKINLGSDIIIGFEMQDENNDGIISLNEKITNTITLDNRDSTENEYNALIGFNNSNAANMKLADKIKVYDQNNNEISSDLYTIDYNSSMIQFDMIPKDEMYTIKFDAYYFKESSSKDELTFYVTYQSLNKKLSYSDNVLYEFDKNYTDFLKVDNVVKGDDDKYEIQISLSNLYSDSEINNIIIQSYSKIPLEVDKNSIQITSNNRDLVEETDYSILEGINIYKLYPEEIISIKLEFSINLKDNETSEIRIRYKSDEIYSLEDDNEFLNLNITI